MAFRNGALIFWRATCCNICVYCLQLKLSPFSTSWVFDPSRTCFYFYLRSVTSAADINSANVRVCSRIARNENPAPQLRKRKADKSSTDRAASAGNERRQKRAASSRHRGEGASSQQDDDQQAGQSGAHTEANVVCEVSLAGREKGVLSI